MDKHSDIPAIAIEMALFCSPAAYGCGYSGPMRRDGTNELGKPAYRCPSCNAWVDGKATPVIASEEESNL